MGGWVGKWGKGGKKYNQPVVVDLWSWGSVPGSRRFKILISSVFHLEEQLSTQVRKQELVLTNGFEIRRLPYLECRLVFRAIEPDLSAHGLNEDGNSELSKNLLSWLGSFSLSWQCPTRCPVYFLLWRYVH